MTEYRFAGGKCCTKGSYTVALYVFAHPEMDREALIGHFLQEGPHIRREDIEVRVDSALAVIP